MELAERAALVLDVDQRRAGGDDVDGLAFDLAEVVGGGADEAAAVGDTELSRELAALVEEVG